jgi:hypothetical protein
VAGGCNTAIEVKRKDGFGTEAKKVIANGIFVLTMTLAPAVLFGQERLAGFGWEVAADSNSSWEFKGNGDMVFSDSRRDSSVGAYYFARCSGVYGSGNLIIVHPNVKRACYDAKIIGKRLSLDCQTYDIRDELFVRD